jgi:hypothetical protein
LLHLLAHARICLHTVALLLPPPPPLLLLLLLLLLLQWLWGWYPTGDHNTDCADVDLELTREHGGLYGPKTDAASNLSLVFNDYFTAKALEVANMCVGKRERENRETEPPPRLCNLHTTSQSHCC